MRHLSPETVSELLYKLTKKELGTRTLITAAVKRVELDSHMAATLTAQNICQNLLALNMAGVEPTKEEFCTYAGKLAETQTLAQLSAEERAVLDQMCSTIETQYGSIPQITQLKEAIKKIK